MQNKALGNIFKGDKGIWMIFFFLCAVSIIEVYSASSMLSYKTGNFWSPIIKHVGLLGLGWLFMVLIANHVPCKYFRALASPYYFFALSLCWLVLFVGKVNDGSRWLNLFGFSVQPSEFAKGALVLMVAKIISNMQTDTGIDKKALKYICYITLPIVFPIFTENLSTAVIICFVIYLLMIVGGIPGKQILKFTGWMMLGIAIFVGIILLVGRDEDKIPQKPLTEMTVEARKQYKEEAKQREADRSFFEKIFHRVDTWKSRITGFFDKKDIAADDYNIIDNSQEGHSKIAIAQSSAFGKGIGSSTEREFLPQAYSDFIYAIIIEEMGYVGGAIVALFYVFLLMRAGKIARRCENTFPALLAIGLALMLVTQALFNMFVAVGLMPVTGQPLPLISKGGTSNVVNCIYLGILLSISRTAKRITPTSHTVVKAKIDNTEATA